MEIPFVTLDDLAMVMLCAEHSKDGFYTQHPQYPTAIRRLRAVYTAAEAKQKAERDRQSDRRKAKTLRFELVEVPR